MTSRSEAPPQGEWTDRANAKVWRRRGDAEVWRLDHYDSGRLAGTLYEGYAQGHQVGSLYISLRNTTGGHGWQLGRDGASHLHWAPNQAPQPLPFSEQCLAWSGERQDGDGILPF